MNSATLTKAKQCMVINVLSTMTKESLFEAIRQGSTHASHAILVVLPDQQVQAIARPDDFLFLKQLKRQLSISIFFVIPSNTMLSRGAKRHGFTVYHSESQYLEALKEQFLHLPITRPLALRRTDALSEQVLIQQDARHASSQLIQGRWRMLLLVATLLVVLCAVLVSFHFLLLRVKPQHYTPTHASTVLKSVTYPTLSKRGLALHSKAETISLVTETHQSMNSMPLSLVVHWTHSA